MDIKIRPLRYFIAAAECGSLTEAANKMNISQPSISAAILEMEESLDLQLFVRFPSKGIRLTTQGIEILKEARTLIKHAETFRALTGAVSSQMRGDLSVACFLNIGSNYLSEIVKTFGEKYPDINLHIYDLDQSDIFQALADGKVEMALTFDLNIPNSIKTRHVVERGAYALLPSNDPLTKKNAVSLKDLTTRPFVLMDLPHTGEYFISLFSKQNLSPKIRYRTKLFETVRTFVASGLGVSILNLKPKPSITYNGNEVTIRPIIDNIEPLNIVLIHYSRLQPRLIADTFSDHVIDFFQGK